MPYALISVSDKTGIEQIAIELENRGYGILSTSSTARHLRGYCREVTEVSDLTGFPEILDGRVKTLHPRIHGGILADRDIEEHLQTLQAHDISPIDIVIVNLYPFAKTVADPKSDHDLIIENIDIGGPTLLRAAAKNYRHVMVITDPADYQQALTALDEGGEMALDFREYLAKKVFASVSAYDAMIATYLGGRKEETVLPAELFLSLERRQILRYGENPHQAGALYASGKSLFRVLHGKEMSYTNNMDVDAAFRAIRLFPEPSAIIFKHCNPCGVGSGANITEAYALALATDTVSPYGGIVIVNRVLDMDTAQAINQVFTEIIVAPGYADGVLEFLMKKKDRRLVEYSPQALTDFDPAYQIRSLTNSILIQEWDRMEDDGSAWQVVTRRSPDPDELQALRFSWACVSIMTSNAIALCSKDQALGLGMGQTSRIDSTEIAVRKAKRFGHDLQGAVCASDGFFPFRDSIDELYVQGIRAVIQPGGSKGDPGVIAACDELGIAMIFTGVRHFKH